MNIKAPIFITGIGRCGSTIIYDVLSEHEQVAWLSDICSKYPSKPYLNKLLLSYVDVPILKKIIRHRFQPSECYKLWDQVSRGFSTPFRDLVADDVTNYERKKIINTLNKIPTQKRNRLMVKITGWSRIGFLKEIFPDAKFIHVVRDGRAVVNSILNVDFWWGWRGPWNWRWGKLSEEQYLLWEKYDKSFVALAAIEWNLIMDSFELAKESMNSENYLEIKYEDFCSNTTVKVKQICEFANLNWSKKFEDNITKYQIKSTNTKWVEDLNSGNGLFVNVFHLFSR